nr:preprotein translocase [Candidatus Liberibacter americanus]
MVVLMALLDFLKNVKIEVKKIIWPSRNEVVVSAILVMIMLVVSSVFFLMVDHFIGSIMSFILYVR